jgi:hypothetical protein
MIINKLDIANFMPNGIDNQKLLHEAITDYFKEAKAANNPALCQLQGQQRLLQKQLKQVVASSGKR